MEQSKTLVQLVGDELEIIEKLYASGGEITPEIEAAMQVAADQLPAKVDAYSYRMDRLDVEVAYIEMKRDEIAQVLKTLKKAKDYLKENIKAAMLTLDKMELSGNDRRFKLSAVRPSVDIHDESLIPSKFIKEKITFEVDRDAIRKALDGGEEIPGARLIQTYSLQSYRAKKG